MSEPNLSIIKIEAVHCYSCGVELQKEGKHKKSMHHAIPQFHKPKRNVLIPICDGCHKEINKYTVQSVPKLEALGNFIKSMEQFIKKYKEVINTYEKEI